MKYEERMIRAIERNNINSMPKNLRASSPDKISLHPNNSFSLPAGSRFSCCGETNECKTACYAKRHNFMFDASMNLIANNWLLIKFLDAVESNKNGMIEAISEIIPQDIELFRIHEVGDFISQGYLNAWTQVIRSRPEVKFWAYTRVFDLNYQKIVRLANFNLFASTDLDNMKEAIKFVKRYQNSFVKHAYGPWPKQVEMPKNSFVCPSASGKIEHAGACEKCKLCVIKGKCKKHVVFPKR